MVKNQNLGKNNYPITGLNRYITKKTSMQKKLRSHEMHGVEKTGSNNDWFSVEELEAARAAYLEEQQQDNPSPHVKLRYALTLVKSKKREDKKRGLGLLDGEIVYKIYHRCSFDSLCRLACCWL